MRDHGITSISGGILSVDRIPTTTSVRTRKRNLHRIWPTRLSRRRIEALVTLAMTMEFRNQPQNRPSFGTQVTFSSVGSSGMMFTLSTSRANLSEIEPMQAIGMTIGSPPRNSTIRRRICTLSRDRPPMGFASAASVVGRTRSGTWLRAVIGRGSRPEAGRD